MLVYADTSVLVRAYLVDEDGHDAAAGLLVHPDLVLVTMSWTRVEATSALIRAARAGRGDEPALLRVLAADLSPEGPVTMLRADPSELEGATVKIIEEFGLRSLDARHLAGAQIAAVPLLEPATALGFATRDEHQLAAATALGFVAV